MAVDPYADIDEGDDIESNAYASGYAPTAEPALRSPSMRRVTPDVYSPTADDEEAPTPRPAIGGSSRFPYHSYVKPRFDPYTRAGVEDPNREAFTFTPEKVEPKANFWNDAGRTIWGATMSMGQELVGAGAAITEQLKAPEYTDWLNSKRAQIGESIKENEEKMSLAARNALHASILASVGAGGTDAEGNRVPSPGEVGWGNYLTYNALALLPTLATAVIPASIAGKIAIKAVGMGARAAALGTTGGIFGAQNAGALYGEVHDEIAKAKPADLMTSPVYAAAIQAGKSDGEARMELSRSLAGVFVLGGMVGAAAGIGLGGMVKGGIMSAGAGMVRRGLIGGAEGAALMGGQSGVNEAANQQAQQAMGTRQGYDVGQIAAQAASGAVGGAAIGAVGGMIHRAPERASSATDGGPGVDETAALTDQLRISGPKAPLQITHDPGFGGGGGGGSPPGLTFDPNAPGPRFGEGFAMAGAEPPTPAPPQLTFDARTPPEPGQSALSPINVRYTAPGEGPTVPPPPSGGVTGGAEFRPPVEPTEPTKPLPVAQAATGEEPTKAAAATQAAVATSKGEARPSAGMKRADLADALAGQVDPKALKSWSRDKMAAEFDQRNPTETPRDVTLAASTTEPDVTTVVSGAGREPPASSATGERLGQAPTVAAPSPSATAGSLPARTEAAGAKITLEAEKPAAKSAAPGQDARAAKRAAAKAKVAGPTQVAQAAAHVAEETRVKPDAGELAPPRDEGAASRQTMGERLSEVVRSIPAKSGSALEAAIRKAQRHMADAIGKSDGSHDAAAEIIDQWHEAQPKAPYPGSQVTAKMVATHLMKQLTGRELAEPAHERAELTQTLAEERSRRGAEPKAVADIEQQLAAPASADVGTTEITPVVKKLSDTTDRRRKADELVEKVLDANDPMTAHEADRIYGAPQKGVGRKRRPGLEYLSNRVRHWLEHAEDTDKERDALIARAEHDRDTQLTGKEKETKTKELQAALDKTGPERAEKLREMLREIEDPVGKVTDDQRKAEMAAAMREGIAQKKTGGAPQENRPAPREATPDGIPHQSSTYVRRMQDPRIGQNLIRLLRDAHKEGRTLTLRDVIQHIRNDPLARSEARPLVALADRLLKSGWLPDVQVYSPHTAYRRGLMGMERYARFAANEIGGYSWMHHPSEPHIVLNESQGASGHLETALHEAVHAVTSRYVDHLLKIDPNHRDLELLRAIGREIQEQANATHLLPDEFGRIEYALTDPHELIAALMTNPEVQAFAARTMASDKFRQRMSELGYPPREAGRSIWRAFTDWVRRALGLNAPASASEYTVLDHVLQPMGDIMQRGGEHGRTVDEIMSAGEQFNRVAPRDPELRAQAEPQFHQVTDMARQAADHARREAPWLRSSILDRLRPATMAITNMDQMVPRYGDLTQPSDRLHMPAGNPLRRIQLAGEAIAHASKNFLDKFTNRTNDLIEKSKSLPPATQEAVGKLLVDATIANAHLGDGLPASVNAHLTRPEQQRTLVELQRRFNALSPAAKEVHQGYVKQFAEMGQRDRDAKLAGIMGTVFPEATPAQRTAFAQAARTKDTLEAFIASPDTSRLAREYGPDEWTKVNALYKGVAEALNGGWQRGDYVPLRRHGDYAITYGEKGQPSEGFERFDTRGQAEARYAELKRQGVDHISHVDLLDANALREVTDNHPLVNRTVDAAARNPALAPHAEAIRDLMSKLVVDSMSNSEASRLRRRGIQGASTDYARILARETQDQATRIGYLEHGGERFKALTDMRLIQRDLAQHGEAGQSRAVQQLINELEKRVTNQESPGGATASLLRKANAFGYLQSLMSFSHAMTSTIENYSMAIPQLGARHGNLKASLALSRGLKDLVRPMLASGGVNSWKALAGKLKQSDWNLSDVMGDHLIAAGYNASHVRAVTDMLKRTGLVDHSFYNELRRLANPQGVTTGVGRTFERFTNFMGAFGHSVDAMNRTNVAMTAFRLEHERLRDLPPAERMRKSVEYAEQRAREASPNYNLANKNRFSTSAGPLGAGSGPVTQFKQYGFFAYGILANALRESMKGATKESRSEARKAFAGMLATHAMTAGVLTLIADPLRYAMGLYDFATHADKPHDYQADIRGFLSDAMGPEAAAIVSRGLGEVLGGSIYRRVGFANVLEIPALESFDMPGVLKMVGTAMIGASGEDATKFSLGLQKALNGDVGGALKEMLPRPVRDVMTAVELSSEGVKTQRGRVLLPPGKITAGDIAWQAAGFQPTRVAEAREGSAAIEQARDEARSEHTRLTNAWLEADSDERSDIMSKIRVFNQDPLHAGTRITMQQLLQAQQNRRKQARAPYGLRLPSKGAAALINEGRFANVQ